MTSTAVGAAGSNPDYTYFARACLCTPLWTDDEIRGDLTPTPVADTLFASTFTSTFAAFMHSSSILVYPNSTAYDPRRNITTRLQSWEFQPGLEFGSDLAGMTFIAPDFNTRKRAPPPCPGHSLVGGCGVPGQADLHDFAGGTLEWFEERLDALASRRGHFAASDTVLDGSVVLLTHQPFRCAPGVPDWYFCFSGSDKATLRKSIDRHGLRAAFFGQLAGHQHRWFNGKAFDEPSWSTFRQWENSAVKGDKADHAMASSLSVFTVQRARVTGVTQYWQECGVWRNQTSSYEPLAHLIVANTSFADP